MTSYRMCYQNEINEQIVDFIMIDCNNMDFLSYKSNSLVISEFRR